MKLALTGALVCSALFASSASAAVTVNTTTDSNAPGGCAGLPGDCSLHQAVAVASPGETVIVPAGTYPISLGGLTITQAAERSKGAGARATKVIVDGGTSAHAFVVSSPDRVTISGMTISAGHVVGEGIDFLHGGAVCQPERIGCSPWSGSPCRGRPSRRPTPPAARFVAPGSRTTGPSASPTAR